MRRINSHRKNNEFRFARYFLLAMMPVVFLCIGTLSVIFFL